MWRAATALGAAALVVGAIAAVRGAHPVPQAAAPSSSPASPYRPPVRTPLRAADGSYVYREGANCPRGIVCAVDGDLTPAMADGLDGLSLDGALRESAVWFDVRTRRPYYQETEVTFPGGEQVLFAQRRTRAVPSDREPVAQVDRMAAALQVSAQRATWLVSVQVPSSPLPLPLETLRDWVMTVDLPD